MYEILMYLVSVHAQVSRVAESLLDRTLNTLVDDLAEEALRCFRQVKRFGMGGMLRVGILPNHHSSPWYLTYCTNRRRLRSNSCIRPSRATSLLLPRRHFPTYTTRSHKHTPADLETKIFKAISTASRRRLPRLVGQLELSSCVSGRRRSGLEALRALLARGRKRTLADQKKANETGYLTSHNLLNAAAACVCIKICII